MAASTQRLGHIKRIEDFCAHLQGLGLDLPVDEHVLTAAKGSPMAEPCQIGHFAVGNRWCIQPMEGWDGTEDGKPTPLTKRRWQNFGISGAKLIWGGEAFAVQSDGRANPNQLLFKPENIEPLNDLFHSLITAHCDRFGQNADRDLLIGLQLTHSGRFCRPHDKARLEPRIVYHHPMLDKKFNIDPGDNSVVVTDDYIKRLIDRYVQAAKVADEIGFRFVDVKHCHGYLGHEFLSAFNRPGPYGGDLEGRTRFLSEIVQGIRAEAPNLMVGVRLSIFDTLPYHPDSTRADTGKLGPGIPDSYQQSRQDPYPGFGCNRQHPLEPDLSEPIQLLRWLRDDLKVAVVNLTAGSPYYNPHIQRPALFPPSDGYQPPEDPLVGCVRQIQTVKKIRKQLEGLPIVGSAYTYLQEWLPHVAQAVVGRNEVDFVGLGRMVLAYPDLPADLLEQGRAVKMKQICRTFSDCTTGPRNGLISGCFPLDDFYKKHPDNKRLKAAKTAQRQQLRSADES